MFFNVLNFKIIIPNYYYYSCYYLNNYQLNKYYFKCANCNQNN